jgi:hypothetical protein
MQKLQALTQRLATERLALEQMRQAALMAEREMAIQASEPTQNPSYPPDPYWGWGTYSFFPPYPCPRCGYLSPSRGYQGTRDQYPGGRRGSGFVFLQHEIRHGNAPTTLELGYGNTHRGRQRRSVHPRTEHAAAAYSDHSRRVQGRRGMLGILLRPGQGTHGNTHTPSAAFKR